MYHVLGSAMEGVLTPSSQVRQGIANNTKGTAFVVYEDVMDAKMACDKLNGFNFQNRYLVGTSSSHLPYPRDLSNTWHSTIPPTREDGPIERGLGSPQGEFRAAQKAARHRITNRRARDPPTSSSSPRSGRGPVIYTCVRQAEGQFSLTTTDL
jgi:RNA recognition motif-containing protein